MKRQKRTNGYHSFRRLERDAKRLDVSPLDLMLLGARAAKKKKATIAAKSAA